MYIIKNLSKLKRYIFKFIITLLSIIIVSIVIKYVLLESQNYLFRLLGVISFWNLHKDDYYHLVFGFSEIVYNNSNSYFENVWLAGNFLKGTLDGVNVNFTGIR